MVEFVCLDVIWIVLHVELSISSLWEDFFSYVYVKRELNVHFFPCIAGVDEFNDPKLTLEEALADNQRIDYHFRHLYYLRASIKSGFLSFSLHCYLRLSFVHLTYSLTTLQINTFQ
jgi:beta-glucosidase/6-phospho-beta-glucosidase/beta-galactosidase